MSPNTRHSSDAKPGHNPGRIFTVSHREFSCRRSIRIVPTPPRTDRRSLRTTKSTPSPISGCLLPTQTVLTGATLPESSSTSILIMTPIAHEGPMKAIWRAPNGYRNTATVSYFARPEGPETSAEADHSNGHSVPVRIWSDVRRYCQY